MPIYTVHVPPGVADAAAGAEGTVFVREGFGWCAFLLGPLALLYRGLWLATALWVLCGAALFALAGALDLGILSRLGLYLVLALLTGLEAADGRQRSLARRGFIPSALLAAASRDAAERRFFGGDAPLAGPGGVGLFPSDGGRA